MWRLGPKIERKGKRWLNKIASMDSFDGLLLRIALDLRCVILESLQVNFTESTLIGYWQAGISMRTLYVGTRAAIKDGRHMI